MEKGGILHFQTKNVILIFETRVPGFFSSYANEKLYQIIKDEEISRVALKTKDTCLQITRIAKQKKQRLHFLEVRM